MLLFIILLAFISIAVALAWFLISNDRGEKEPATALWLAVSFGLGGGLLASWLEDHLVPLGNLLPGLPYETLLITGLAIAAIEEGCKFIPLALFIYKKPYFNEHTDGIIYFALAGLGLGLPENIIYTLQLGTEAGVVRLLMTPLFQAATTGVIGYFLVRGKLAKRSPLAACLPLAAMIILHGIYDFGLLSNSIGFAAVSLLITVSMNITLIALFFHARQLDRKLGLSAT